MPRDQGCPAIPPTEESPLQPINLTGRASGTQNFRETVDGLRWTILRPTLVYGPRDRLFLPLFKLARYGVFPVPNARAVYNVVHVEDLARGVEAVATSGISSETFFLGHPEPVGIMELMARLASVFGRQFRPITVPRMALRAMAEVGSLVSFVGIRAPIDRSRWKEIDADGFVCRIDKARDRLGFVATIDQREGLAETATWYIRNGWLKGNRKAPARRS